MLSYRDTLPPDLAPMIVLDASGRVRETYAYMEKETGRGIIERLREARKDYAPLTVHTWQVSGSKSGFETNGPDLIAGIAQTIMTKPDERWLCVHHKRDRKVGDVAKGIRQKLDADVWANVRTITWGEHMATNLYADVPNVILAGTLFMRPSHYTALTHLAQGQDTAPGLASPEDVARTTRGEHANFILQALCRGRVRKSNGDRCLPMTAYIIASARSGIPDDLTTIFPGCTVLDWNARKKGLTGKPKMALEFITTALGDAPWVSYRDVAAGIGSKDYGNFKKLVLKHPDWPATIAHSSLEEATAGPKNARGVRAKAADSSPMAA
jgi:hypothetical protein